MPSPEDSARRRRNSISSSRGRSGTTRVCESVCDTVPGERSGDPPRLVSPAVHVGFSLLTLFPGRVGGSETYVRGLLGEFARGHGPERLTVLANRQVAEAYRGYAAGPVELRRVGSYRAGNGL